VRARARWLGLSCALLAALGAAAPAHASADVETAIAAARSRELAGSAVWRALVHYRRLPLRPGWTSQADGAAFFLAAGGKRDPQAELEASLRALLAAESTAPDAHPRCKFPGRYAWLARELELPETPAPPCPRYQEFRDALDPVGATLIFAEAFMNNPASMFGHTLLRIDTRKGRDLLGWAVNFAGATGDDGGIVYAARGLTGRYQGYFSVVPYYEKVKSYGDWENRDIWEYDLALTPEELELLIAHLWELEAIAFDYYYFDENCSQQLLALLEAVRPALREREFVPPWVIPADTVRVADRHGLVTDVRYRPSAATRLRHEAGLLPRGARRLALEIAGGELEPEAPELDALSAPERAAVLSVAYDLLRHRYLGREVARDESAGRARRILLARSRAGVRGAPPEPPRPALRPDQGHGSARAAALAGARDGTPFVELRFRPAFHDLLDPQGGYVRGAQIDFLDTALRVYPEDGTVRLQELVALDMTSLTPWDPLFRPWSFRVETGLRTRLVPGHDGLDDEPVFRSAAGFGLSFDLGRGALFYALAEATGEAGAALRENFALGAGGTAGVLASTPGDRWRGQLFARATRFQVGDLSTALSAGLMQRLTLTRWLALEARTSYERDFGQDWFLGSGGARVYF
jgi:hypothetical protein